MPVVIPKNSPCFTGRCGSPSNRRNLNEFLWFESPARKTRLAYGTLEIVHAIDSNAYRSVAFALWCKADRGLSLERAIHIATEFSAVVHHGNVIPRTKRVKEVAIEKRLTPGRRVHEGVQAPAIGTEARLE